MVQLLWLSTRARAPKRGGVYGRGWVGGWVDTTAVQFVVWVRLDRVGLVGDIIHNIVHCAILTKGIFSHGLREHVAMKSADVGSSLQAYCICSTLDINHVRMVT